MSVLFIIYPPKQSEGFMTERTTGLVEGLRHSVPYINTHQRKIFVIFLTDAAIESDNYPSIINDIGLLHSLGIKLVIVYGARRQIDAALAKQAISPVYHKSIRITSKPTLMVIKQTAGLLLFDITSRLSMSLSNTPLAGAEIHVVSGNFIIAKPLGVSDGIDYCHTGKIRRIHCDRITKQLQNNNIVLLSPISVSVTGESFNLASEEIAAEVAIKLQADKLISYGHQQGIVDDHKKVIADLLPNDAEHYAEKKLRHDDPLCNESRFLKMAAKACRNGVYRCHIISYHIDGALLQEIFSRDGIGTQVSMAYSEQIRNASTNDIGGILDLIKPLEDEGILVPRYREQLESEISQFIVIERDNIKIGCASLQPFEKEQMGEMACMAIHPHYRSSSRGDTLLLKTIEKAKQLNLTKLFVLTTQSIHWFQERGFVPASVDDLPVKKKAQYNYQRNSKVLILELN